MRRTVRRGAPIWRNSRRRRSVQQAPGAPRRSRASIPRRADARRPFGLWGLTRAPSHRVGWGRGAKARSASMVLKRSPYRLRSAFEAGASNPTQIQRLRVSCGQMFWRPARCREVCGCRHVVIRPSPLDDEWWTTAMVCAYLKLGKRALWDIRCDPTKGFPKALKPGGKVNLYRALDVRDWLENRRASNSTAQPKAPGKKYAPTPAASQTVAQPPSITITAAATPPKRVPRRKPAVDPRQLVLF